MKILQLVTQMEAGGAQRVAILLADALRNYGYEVEVGFLYLKRPTFVSFSGVKVLLEHKPLALDYFKIIYKLHKYINYYQPDILITHTHYANILGNLVGYLCGIKKRIAVQHNPVNTYPKLAALLDSLIGATSFYTNNIGVSQVVIDSVESYSYQYKKKLKKIYNGINHLPCNNVSPVEVRQNWNLPENVPLLINVGRLAKQKNQSILIEALIHLPEVHLVLIGDGELSELLHNLVAQFNLNDRVHFLGELKSEDVLKLLSVANAFLFPSLYEAMPMALVEAMSSGLPIIGSDIPAMKEVLGDAGILVPGNSVEAIVKAVRQVLDVSELASQMRKSSLERAKLFSVEQMVASYEELFS